MTSNQIAYWKALWEKTENIRHNRAMEQETNRHNVVTESQNAWSIEEGKRHNLENELIGYEQASASQTAAAASYVSALANKQNAQTRVSELNEAIRVNTASIKRENALNTAKISEINSVVGLNRAKSNESYVNAERLAAQAGLYSVQTVLEQERVGLVQQQIKREQAQTVKTYFDTADVVFDDIVGVGKLIPMFK